MNDLIKMIPCYLKFVVTLLINLVASVFVLAVFGSIFFPDLNPIAHLHTLINSFLTGGFTGLLGLVVFVYFVWLCKSDSCSSKHCDTDK